jgi:hypothetical protein
LYSFLESYVDSFNFDDF